MKPTHLDLFSGIGGFTLAAEWAGFETIGFSEIDPYASAVLKKHYPAIPNYGDIKQHQDWPKMHPNLLTAGPPCQPASCAGKRRGSEDDRWLWPETLDCVEQFKPDFCLFENPLGFLTLNGGMEIGRVYARMEGLSYDVCEPLVIPACAVGAGHRRMRIWIAGHNSHCNIIQGRQIERQKRKEKTRTEQLSGHVFTPVWNAVSIARIWRTTHGVSNRLDSRRNITIGNAIVPQVAYVILKAIAEMIPRDLPKI